MQMCVLLISALNTKHASGLRVVTPALVTNFYCDSILVVLQPVVATDQYILNAKLKN